MKKILCVMALLLLVASSAFATAVNVRPGGDIVPYFGGTEPDLQDIFNARTNPTGTPLNAVTDQSLQALWGPSDGNTNAYLVTQMQTGASGTIGIYNSLFEKVDLATYPAWTVGGNTEFSVNKSDGNLYDSAWNLLGTNFNSFGFYWEKTDGTTFYTEDDKNGDVAYALTYQLGTGTEVLYNPTPIVNDILFTADGSGLGNDWILAFEDYTDFDFQDAVFLIEDMAPVPEPGTLLLLGSGLIGLAYLKRRKS